MKLKDIPDPVWLGLGLAVAGLVMFRLLKSGAGAVGNAINPVNHDNVFSSGVNAAGSALTGSDWSLGSSLFNAVNEVGSWLGGKDDDDIAAPVTQTAVPVGTTKTRFDNPTNVNTNYRSAIVTPTRTDSRLVVR